MLLIGSRAAKYHFPFFRQPRDYDFIASEKEVKSFLSNFNHTDTSSHPGKIRARVELDRPTSFEFELNDSYPSSSIIYKENKYLYKDEKLKTSYHIAIPSTLLLLKKSHLPFNIHWQKNMTDFLYLQYNIPNDFDKNWYDLLQMRFEEIKNRVKYKERNFDLSNSEFFNMSEKLVNRKMPHDDIHYATCFYDKPLFLSVKDDINKAAMNPDKVNALSDDLKIKLIQEEIMALSIERFIIPNKDFCPKKAYAITTGKMIHNYLPMFLRFFAIDNYLKILNLGFDYVKKFNEIYRSDKLF